MQANKRCSILHFLGHRHTSDAKSIFIDPHLCASTIGEGLTILDGLRMRQIRPPVGFVGSFGLLCAAPPHIGAFRATGPPILLTAKVTRAEERLFKDMVRGLPSATTKCPSVLPYICQH